MGRLGAGHQTSVASVKTVLPGEVFDIVSRVIMTEEVRVSANCSQNRSAPNLVSVLDQLESHLSQASFGNLDLTETFSSD